MLVRARARIHKENQCELRVASCASPQIKGYHSSITATALAGSQYHNK